MVVSINGKDRVNKDHGNDPKRSHTCTSAAAIDLLLEKNIDGSVLYEITPRSSKDKMTTKVNLTN